MPTQHVVAVRKLRRPLSDPQWQDHLDERLDVDEDDDFQNYLGNGEYHFVESVSRTGFAAIGAYNGILEVNDGSLFLAEVEGEDNEIPRGCKTIEELYAWYCSYFKDGMPPLFSQEELQAYLDENVGDLAYEEIEPYDMDDTYRDSFKRRGLPLPANAWD